jgi:predicted small metal-binding protein
MDKVINCSCGVAIRGADDAEIVASARRHAQEVHDLELTEEQATGMLQPA